MPVHARFSLHRTGPDFRPGSRYNTVLWPWIALGHEESVSVSRGELTSAPWKDSHDYSSQVSR